MVYIIYTIFREVFMPKKTIGAVKNVLASGLILALLAMPLFFSGCKDGLLASTPTPTPGDYFSDITFEVTGTGGTTQANINYGDEKYVDCSSTSQLRWICTGVTPAGCVSSDSPCYLASQALPWSTTISTCKGHPVKIGVSEGMSGTAILKIYNDGVLVAQNEIDFLGNLEYNVPN
jgi:hypothetical protein